MKTRKRNMVLTLTVALVLSCSIQTFGTIESYVTAEDGRDETGDGWQEVEAYSGWASSTDAYAWDGATWSTVYAHASTPTCKVRKYAVCEQDTLSWEYAGKAYVCIWGHAWQTPDDPDTVGAGLAQAEADIDGTSSSGSHQQQTPSRFQYAREDKSDGYPSYFHISSGWWYIGHSGTTSPDGAFCEVEHSCSSTAWTSYDASDMSAQARASVSTCTLGGQ